MTNQRPGFLLLAAAFLAAFPAVPLRAQSVDRRLIELKVDVSEAEAVLAILAARKTGAAIDEDAWGRLFSSEPYARLKKREASLHRDFTDNDFKRFVLSPQLQERAPDLRHTLTDWIQADLTGAARRMLVYLPADASIRARVYPVIKPATNSFVFEVTTDPAIFLYLDPKVTPAKFENTVAHELHHIGYASVAPREEGKEDAPPASIQAAIEWMGAFGEGFAMLAAAGSPNVHPHAASEREERSRWDRDMAHFNRDLNALERFFLEIIDGRLKTKEEIQERGFSFFGVQGPWYTVGYRMAVLIEKRDGRAALVACMSDPRRLLAAYNRAAAQRNARRRERLALWSPRLLEQIGAKM